MTSNVQIDRFLNPRLKNLQLIPSQSYEGVFTYYGDFHPRLSKVVRGEANAGSFAPYLRPYGFIMNLDKESGPGNHWVAFAIARDEEGLVVFYYDPMLPNKFYEIPSLVQRFLIRFQERGGRLITNLEGDQVPKLPNGNINAMCGAYSAMMLLGLDATIMRGRATRRTIDRFYDMHEELEKPSLVKRVFDEIQSVEAV